MSTVDLGQYAQWYNFATSDQMMEFTGMDPYDEDVQNVLDSYGLNYIGWAVAKDEYFDTLMDSGLEYCIVAQDPETQKIDLYEWVGERLYPAIDAIMSVDFDDYEDEDMLYEYMDVKTALIQALNESLIDYDEVEFMDDMELEEFLQDNLNDYEQEVLSELGMILEPSGSGAVGSFFLMDEKTGQELAEIDFREYNDKELELSTECDDVNQYKERYKAWVEGFKYVDETIANLGHYNKTLDESTLSDIKQSQAVWDWYKNHYEPYQIQDFIEFIQNEVDLSPDKFAKIIINGLSDYEKARILEFE